VAANQQDFFRFKEQMLELMEGKLGESRSGELQRQTAEQRAIRRVVHADRPLLTASTRNSARGSKRASELSGPLTLHESQICSCIANVAKHPSRLESPGDEEHSLNMLRRVRARGVQGCYVPSPRLPPLPGGRACPLLGFHVAKRVKSGASKSVNSGNCHLLGGGTASAVYPLP
jgi:hypothetical protein